jgi:ADP-ribosyl-[dinitrogen reductase] hydrolase
VWKKESVGGPGGACTSAAHSFRKNGDWSKCGAPVGQAGNGTAMRTAVVGLFFLNDPDRLPVGVADVCRITHQDPRSVAGGIAVAKAAQILLVGGFRSSGSFCEEIARAVEAFEPTFAKMVREIPCLLQEEPTTAIRTIAWSGMSRPEFAEPIITPFVVPTVLAALWCLLRHSHSWGKAVASAIRLGGDVDTLGAIVGALLGAKLGAESIPRTSEKPSSTWKLSRTLPSVITLW